MGNIFTWLIVQPMGFIIELIYNFIPNYGVALIIFTIIIKLLILPLNLKSQKSMVKQQKLMPQLQELQKKYANDKEKLNKEMMELYQANGANPASGCLADAVAVSNHHRPVSGDSKAAVVHAAY